MVGSILLPELILVLPGSSPAWGRIERRQELVLERIHRVPSYSALPHACTPPLSSRLKLFAGLDLLDDDDVSQVLQFGRNIDVLRGDPRGSTSGPIPCSRLG